MAFVVALVAALAGGGDRGFSGLGGLLASVTAGGARLPRGGRPRRDAVGLADFPPAPRGRPAAREEGGCPVSDWSLTGRAT